MTAADQKPECKHLNTRLWEPHLAGARKCNDCGMVYHPQANPKWYFEKPYVDYHAEYEKALDEIAYQKGTIRGQLEVIQERDKRINEDAIEFLQTKARLDAATELIGKCADALNAVCERHKNHGNDARKHGVSTGLNHVCERALAAIEAELAKMES